MVDDSVVHEFVSFFVSYILDEFLSSGGAMMSEAKCTMMSEAKCRTIAAQPQNL